MIPHVFVSYHLIRPSCSRLCSLVALLLQFFQVPVHISYMPPRPPPTHTHTVATSASPSCPTDRAPLVPAARIFEHDICIYVHSIFLTVLQPSIIFCIRPLRLCRCCSSYTCNRNAPSVLHSHGSRSSNCSDRFAGAFENADKLTILLSITGVERGSSLYSPPPAFAGCPQGSSLLRVHTAWTFLQK